MIFFWLLVENANEKDFPPPPHKLKGEEEEEEDNSSDLGTNPKSYFQFN
jgi:hypothetical protein